MSVCTDIPRPHAAERPARPQARRAETRLPVCPSTGPRPAPTLLSVQLLPPALGPELTSELGRFPQGCARGVGARVPNVATAGVARAAGCFAGLRARGGAPPRGTGLLALTGSHGRGRGQWSVCWSPRLFKAMLGRGALLTLLWGHREPPRPVVGTAVQRPSLPSVLGPLRPGYTSTVPPSSCRGRSHTAGPAARDF